MKTLRSRFRDDRGASAVIVALLLIVFIGFAALVVDMGYAYSVKRQLQAAADAAALAGCQELILGGSETNVRAVALTYAETHNAVPPGEDLVMLTGSPEFFEVTPDYVKVTVEKPMSLFFGRVFADESGMIRAQAKARIAYLTGAKSVVPLSVPILRATRVTARIGGAAETNLSYDSGAGEWVGAVPIPGALSSDGYRVDVAAYNNQVSSDYPNGVPLELPGAGAVMVQGAPTNPPVATGVLLSTSLSDNYRSATAGGTFTFRARVAGDPSRVTVSFNGSNNVNMTRVGSTNEWVVTLATPTTGGLVGSYPIEMEVRYAGNTRYSLDEVARVVVRRSTYPIANVTVSPTVAAGPSPSAATVRVRFNEYEYGVRYELKVVGGGGEVGNFLALDLNTLRHYDVDHKTGPLEYPSAGGGGANAYRDFIGGGYPNVVHIGDSVWSETGNMRGPTSQGFNDRFSGDANRTFEQWEAAGRPATKRVVYVPVVEIIGKNAANPTAGTTPFRIVQLAAFYVDPDSSGASGDYIVRGRFIEYMLPSDDITDTPPDGFYIMTPRLVTPDF